MPDPMVESLCDLSGGEIRTAPLAAILVEALRRRVTGELRIEANGGTSRVYFRGGHPCGAQIFFGFKPLGQFLLELGWIDIEALERSLAAVVDGRKQGEALVELGYLTAEQLHHGLTLHHQRHLRTLAEVSEGTYSFQHQQSLPQWTDELHLSAHRAILDAFAAPPGKSLGRRLLRRVPPGLGLRLRTGWERWAGHFQLDGAERNWLAALERPKSIDVAVIEGDLPEERALALLATLHLMGILVPAPLGAEPPWATPGPALPSTPGPIPADPPASAKGRAAAEEAGPVPQNRAAAEEERTVVDAPTVVASSFGEDGTRPAVPPQAQPPEVTVPFDAGVVGQDPDPVEIPPARAGGGVRSDAEEARERRARLLKRAFASIPGAAGLHRPVAGPPDREAAAAPQRAPANGAGPSFAFGSWDSFPQPGDPAFEGAVRERLAVVAKTDHFARLGLSRTANRDAIKQAWFAAARRLHPDRMPQGLSHLARELKELFGAVTESYQLLQDDERRRDYLAELEAAENALPPAERRRLQELEAQAASAFQRRDFAAAERALQQALLVEDRPDLRAHLLWARQGARPSETAQVRAELERLVREKPRCAAAHYYLGVLARVAGETDRAEAAFLRTLEIDPEHPEARQELRLVELRRAGRPQPRRR